MTQAKPSEDVKGWWVCGSCGSLCPSKNSAEECCKDRHNKAYKDVWTGCAS